MNQQEVDADFIGMWMREEHRKVVAESGSDGITYEACKQVVVARYLEAVRRGDLPSPPGAVA